MKLWQLMCAGLLSLVACEMPDAGGGGGPVAGSSGSEGASSASDDSAALEPGTEIPDPAGDAGGAAVDPNVPEPEEALEDLFEDVGQIDTRPAADRIAALASKNKKLLKKATKLSGIVDQLGGPERATDTIERARAFDRLQHLANTNKPELLRILGLDAPATRPAASVAADPSRQLGGARPAVPDLIDTRNLPFDPNENDVNRFMFDVVKQLNANHRELQALKGVNEQSQQERATTQMQARTKSWETAMTAAAAKIADAGVRTLFTDQMKSAFNLGRWKTHTAEFIANHYLTMLKVTPQTRAAVNTAMTQARTAKTTAQLPRQHVGAAGRPAAPAGNTKKTLASIRERLESVDG